jgi:hypothetical protein
MYLIPLKDLRILDPAIGDYLPEEGREVAESSYWHRRLRDKSVVLGTPPERPSAGAKKATAKKSNGQAVAPAADATVTDNE